MVGHNFGFVTFNNSAPVQKVLSSRPIKINGDWHLNVEEIKPHSAGLGKAAHRVMKSTAQGSGGSPFKHNKGTRSVQGGKKGKTAFESQVP